MEEDAPRQWALVDGLGGGSMGELGGPVHGFSFFILLTEVGIKPHQKGHIMTFHSRHFGCLPRKIVIAHLG